MKYSLLLIAVLSFFGLTSATFIKPEVEAKVVSGASDLVVHEWGTFTSIAGKNGVAIDWRPLNGPSDLPSFVYTSGKQGGFRGTFHDPGKGDLARSRMETPVLYFYTGQQMNVSVKVDFPKGKITEWYPQAGLVNAEFQPNRKGRFTGSGINWGTVRLLPDERPDFMREVGNSHYYPARETDAVPIQVCNVDKTKIEKEKFLFYRGIGDFELPLKVRLDGDKIILGSTDDEGYADRAITNIIVFENRGGRVRYQFVPVISGDTFVDLPQQNRDIADVYADLEKVLVGQGLFQKEAKAMIETWKDSWFEEGLRVFYILPRKTTDEVLPLTIEPRPKETIRVLVGRAEVITPKMEKDVRQQVSRLKSPLAATRQNARETLKQHGRFYEPILKSILQSERNAAMRIQLRRLIEAE